jgi:hypothetical protein
MSHITSGWRGFAAAGFGALASSAPAHAHGFAGDRFFPATIASDDPAVADELSLPTISRLGGAREVAAEISRRITSDLAISLGESWTHTHGAGAQADGFQNLETTLKWQFLTDARHEAIASAGLNVEWGAIGAARVGADAVTTITPSLYVGKGLGDLPGAAGWARPFAVTGALGYAVPARARDDAGAAIPDVLSGGFSLQYSLPYLSAHVRDLGWPRWVNQLTPLVEATFERAVRHGDGAPATGALHPGVIWTGRRVQIGAEAIAPINSESGSGIGWSLQAHFFLDDILPRTLGRPMFGGGR